MIGDLAVVTEPQQELIVSDRYFSELREKVGTKDGWDLNFSAETFSRDIVKNFKLDSKGVALDPCMTSINLSLQNRSGNIAIMK